MSDLILYTTEDGRSQIKLRADEQTVWLTQLDIAELFDATKQNISQHLKNIFADGELDPAATVKESLTVQTEGARQVQRPVTLYNLDAILAVGYRVRSPRGVQFRRWASTALKEYLLKGFVMDDERLKNPDGRPDYFDEMLARSHTNLYNFRQIYRVIPDQQILYTVCREMSWTYIPSLSAAGRNFRRARTLGAWAAAGRRLQRLLPPTLLATREMET